ncbi:MAG TPA: hypothetical protein VH351_21675 [Bryobacteraceae bacterium]|jgi:hypothetical protein|nr:hypothetical protein [Bryobacteraceae bacterium]
MQQQLEPGDSPRQTKSGPGFGDFAAPRVLIGAALFFGAILLLSNLWGMPEAAHVYLSSLPLALAGVGYALLQMWLRPARGLMLKRLLLAATFVGWAVDQVLPAGQVAALIGDAVITAYVLDLYWIMQEQTGRQRVSQER